MRDDIVISDSFGKSEITKIVPLVSGMDNKKGEKHEMVS